MVTCDTDLLGWSQTYGKGLAQVFAVDDFLDLDNSGLNQVVHVSQGGVEGRLRNLLVSLLWSQTTEKSI